MSKYKKLNRGGIMFIVIAVILAVMITFEAVNTNDEKKKIFDAAEAYFALEAKYAVLPGNVRGNGTETAAFANYYKQALAELEPMLYTKTSAGKEYVMQKALESLQSAGIYQEKYGTHYSNVEIRIKKEHSLIIINNGGKEATAQIYVEIYAGGDDCLTEHICKLTYIKDGSDWYLLNTQSAFDMLGGNDTWNAPDYENEIIYGKIESRRDGSGNNTGIE